MLLWIMYLLGWLLFLALQISNSLKSNTNGLEYSWKGFKKWLSISLLPTLVRLFFVVIIFPAMIKGPLSSIDALLKAGGFALQGWGLAGLAGFTCEAALYQLTGLIPGLRKEVSSVVPPPPDQPKS